VGDRSAEAGRAEPDTDPALLRRLTAEAAGTFFLVCAAAGADIINELHPGQVPIPARAIAPALIVTAMIYSFGSISGAHLNPAVTIAFAARTVFPWRWVPAYIAAELAGAVAAAATLHMLFDPGGNQGTTHPTGGQWQSFGFETLLTLLLITVILSTATQHRVVGPDAAIPVGATIASAGLLGIAISGASMNPARSIGPAVVAGVGQDQWIYVTAPIVGALCAALLVTIIHGRPKAEEEESAAGERRSS
jgi:aquaporin Z